jgi:di/tricarboxylate transporter
MFSGIASLTVSSALWFTAMAGNPLGAEIARGYGLEIGFGSWFVASSIPTLAAMALLPFVLYRVIRPEVTATPEAPRAARRALTELGPLRPHEKIVAATFAGMVGLWAAAATLGLDSTAVAFLGLGVLLATGVLTLGDIAKEGDVLATFIWFASSSPSAASSTSSASWATWGSGWPEPSEASLRPWPGSCWSSPTCCSTTCLSARRLTFSRSSASSSTSG